MVSSTCSIAQLLVHRSGPQKQREVPPPLLFLDIPCLSTLLVGVRQQTNAATATSQGSSPCHFILHHTSCGEM